jgi:sporulation protein YlmC with PRC-barrel domain
MATELRLGTKASCSDGECGEVRRAVLDPGTRTVTYLVIEHKHRPGSGRLVPVDLVDATGAEIRLRCTLAEFERLDPAEEVDIVQGDNDVGLVIGAAGSSMDVGHRTPTYVTDSVPPGEAEVVRHQGVHAVDGEIGKVDGFAVDPDDHKVTHVLLREGHLWGRKKVAIPISSVTAVDEGIRLDLTKQQVEDLPPLH